MWNRAAILEILHRELARSQRERTPVAAVLADLDHFKKINDTYGHLAGDAVLREVTRRMSATLRPYDALGRYGGEEFLIVAPGCDTAKALNVAERLRDCVGREPVDIFEGSLSIKLSAGVAAGCDAEKAERLVQMADAALYRAKTAGRNRVELALP